MEPKDRLFAVCLGGRASGCNTELHDVVFVTGPTLEATYGQLLEKWFGLPQGLHIDAWALLDVVDGYAVSLVPTPNAGPERLYFVNLGAYRTGELAEIHANTFVVATSAQEAKRRAKASLLTDGAAQVHTDDLYEVDSCIELGAVNEFHVALASGAKAATPAAHNGYQPLPKSVIEAYVARQTASERTGYRQPYD